MEWKKQFPEEYRFFETDNGILYCCDCIDLLKKFPSEGVDMILTDPPFMISQEIKIARSARYKYKGKDISLDFGEWDKQWETKEEYIEWCKIWWDECVRVLKDCRHFLFFFDKAKVSYAWDYLEEKGMKGRGPLFYIKTNPAPRARKVDFMKAVEMCLWFTKGKVTSEFFNWKLGQSKDYIMCPIPSTHSKKDRRIHPTQKPLAFCEWVISYLSKEGDIVLDPFAGSGTTLIASINLGRRWIGIEREPKYCKAMKERILAVLSQPKLFGGRKDGEN